MYTISKSFHPGVLRSRRALACFGGIPLHTFLLVEDAGMIVYLSIYSFLCVRSTQCVDAKKLKVHEVA